MAKLIRDRSTKEKDRWWSEVARAAESAPTLTYERRSAPMANSWPGGHRHAMTQDAHERWNSAHYPGTRQLCAVCDEPTGRCEEDAVFRGDAGPLCDDCEERTDGD